MILKALVQRYEDTSEVPQGWQRRDVRYALDISDEGDLLGIISLGNPDDKKSRGLSLILPSVGSGRSGKKAYETAYFLCDNADYMLGLDQRKNMSACRCHKELLGSIDASSAKAIVEYFSKGAPSFTANKKQKAESSDEIDSYTFHLATKDETLTTKELLGAQFVFQHHGKRVDYTDGDEQIIQAWNMAERPVGREGVCLVTGEYDTIVKLHEKVALRGVTMGKQALISMNEQTSFRSYGAMTSDPPAPIGAKAAFAYVSALNDLLIDKSHHQFIGGDTLVYWAEGKDEVESVVFSLLVNPQESDSDKLNSIMERVAQGKLIDATICNIHKRFYVLCLSPNAARISVRYFHVDDFGNTIKNIKFHYDSLEILSAKKEKFQQLPYWILLSETTVKKAAADAAPLLGGQLLNSIITGARYPVALLNMILGRIRAGEEVNRAKAAIIKASLIRNYKEREVATVALNEESLNVPYTLGRLFSVLERLQERANGTATVRERYFAAACANPGSVFPTLLKLSSHHSAKLDKAVFFEKLKADLLGRLDETNTFPRALALADQGRFILGYYHQTQWFFTPKEEKETSNDKQA